jgi:ribosomal protein S12 methylthiotransferase
MPENLRTFFIENLGCPKNAVEGEGMAEHLATAGYVSAKSAAEADVVVVNTCSFIRPAQEESIDRLFHYLSQRRNGQRVIAAGCLAERYGEALKHEIPELDGILGTRRWHEIDKLLEAVERGSRPCWHGVDGTGEGLDPTFVRHATAPTAYVKIAEGCNMTCTFCAIPSFKGKQRSKAPVDIVREIRELVGGGVQEIILVSQNTTAYGQDFASEPSLHGTTLARLLERICVEVPEMPWLRFHYCYPGWVTEDLLQTMARLDQVVKYFDMPLQHAHPEMLRAMNRPSNVAQIRETLGRARDLMPDIALRTTFIVGFPGETEEHFSAVLDLMREVQFDHVGVFPYYSEEGTPASNLPGPVSERKKQARKRRALEVQQGISLARNQAMVGREVRVLVEGRADQSVSEGIEFVGRTYRDAPEVDGFVLFRGQAEAGQFARVKITGAGPYDLFGEQAGVDLAPAQPRRSPARVGLKSLPVLQPR